MENISALRRKFLFLERSTQPVLYDTFCTHAINVTEKKQVKTPHQRRFLNGGATQISLELFQQLHIVFTPCGVHKDTRLNVASCHALP